MNGFDTGQSSEAQLANGVVEKVKGQPALARLRRAGEPTPKNNPQTHSDKM